MQPSSARKCQSSSRKQEKRGPPESSPPRVLSQGPVLSLHQFLQPRCRCNVISTFDSHVQLAGPMVEVVQWGVSQWGRLKFHHRQHQNIRDVPQMTLIPTRIYDVLINQWLITTVPEFLCSVGITILVSPDTGGTALPVRWGFVLQTVRWIDPPDLWFIVPFRVILGTQWCTTAFTPILKTSMGVVGPPTTCSWPTSSQSEHAWLSAFSVCSSGIECLHFLILSCF